MKTSTISEFKAHISENLRAVRAGQHILILDRSTAIAEVSPVSARLRARIACHGARRAVKGVLDSSAVLRFLLNREPLLRVAESWTWVGASELLFVECHRVLERVRFTNELTSEQYQESLAWLNAFLDGVVLVPIGSSVIRRASRPYPVALKTLDAIHLATLETLSEEDDPTEWEFLTTDKSLGKAAQLLRFGVPGL